jgi:hypothetical protein
MPSGQASGGACSDRAREQCRMPRSHEARHRHGSMPTRCREHVRPLAPWARVLGQGRHELRPVVDNPIRLPSDEVPLPSNEVPTLGISRPGYRLTRYLSAQKARLMRYRILYTYKTTLYTQEDLQQVRRVRQ